MVHSSAFSEKILQGRSQFAQRIEHHAAAGLGVRAVGDLHHHDTANVERSGDEPAFAEAPHRRFELPVPPRRGEDVHDIALPAIFPASKGE